MKKTANQVLAENLDRLMGAKWNNQSLSKKAGLAANTLKNYRNPDREGSANMADLEKLANHLGVSLGVLVTEYVEDGDGQAPPPQKDDPTTLRMNLVSTALDMLTSVLDPVDADGRAIVSPILKSFAVDPHGTRSRLMKAFAAALDAPTPTEPPPGTTTDGGATTPQLSRPNLAVKEGGGQTRSQLELLPKAVRKIVDNTSPESLRGLVDNNNAPPRERTEFYAKLRGPKAAA